jgi:hypothetical protein
MIGRLIDAAAFVVLMPPRVARAPHTDDKADESTCLGESGLPYQNNSATNARNVPALLRLRRFVPFGAPSSENISKIRIRNDGTKTGLLPVKIRKRIFGENADGIGAAVRPQIGLQWPGKSGCVESHRFCPTADLF